MKLYHGGTTKIEKPLILEQQRLLDFGKGFYCTSSKEQAERWAVVKQKRGDEISKAIVSVFELDDSVLIKNQYHLKVFNDASVDWLDFIHTNRNSPLMHTYDIVKGPVANDSLYQTLSLYESGILTKTETIQRLKVHVLFEKMSFHNATVLNELKFIEAYEL